MHVVLVGQCTAKKTARADVPDCYQSGAPVLESARTHACMPVTHSRQRLARARMHIFAVCLFPRCCLFAFTGGRRRRYDRCAMRPRCFARVQADIGDFAGDMMAEPDRTGHRMHQCKSASQHAPRSAICRTIYDCANATCWCAQLHLCAHCH